MSCFDKRMPHFNKWAGFPTGNKQVDNGTVKHQPQRHGCAPAQAMRLSFSSRCEARTDFSRWHDAIRTQEAMETRDTSSKGTRRCRSLGSTALSGHLICTACSEAAAGGEGPLGSYSKRSRLAGSPVAQRVDLPVVCDWRLGTSTRMASPDEFCARRKGERQAHALAVKIHPGRTRIAPPDVLSHCGVPRCCLGWQCAERTCFPGLANGSSARRTRLRENSN